MRSALPRRGSMAARFALVVLAALTCGRRAEPGEPTRAENQATADNQKLPWYEREKGIRALADDYDPPALVPWLRERLGRETDFHVRLALAFALASQGESEALPVLVDSLSETGHFGYIYLSELGGGVFGGPGKGWDKPSWDRWLTRIDPAAWCELQRKRHLPRVPSDADEAGLARAVAWWDTLAYVDLSSLPFVRVMRSSWTDAYGFLLAEQPQGFTVFTTDLAQREYPRERTLRYGKERFRFLKTDLARTAEGALGLAPREKVEGQDEEVEGMDPDELGTDLRPQRIVKGFVLARALVARGRGTLALALWKEIAKEPGPDHRYGTWSCLDLLKASAARASQLAWEEDARRPERTWRQASEAFRLHRRRFDLQGALAATEVLLAEMAADESSYGAAAASTAAVPAERARDLVRGLPTVSRELADWRGGRLREASPSRPAPDSPPDALDGLFGLGYEAVPALQAALRDERPTKSHAEFYGFTKGWIRHDPRHLQVRDLARLAFYRLTERDVPTREGPEAPSWPEVLQAIEAWCDVYRERGERGVLEAGVLARDEVSGRDARLLVTRHPEGALATIRRAAQGAEPEVLATLLDALAPLATPDALAFLDGHSANGPMPVRIAASRAMLAQGHREGLDALRAEWPKVAATPESGWEEFLDDALGAQRRPIPHADLVRFYLAAEAGPSLAYLRTTLSEVYGGIRLVILDAVPRALGYDERGRPPKTTGPRATAEVEREAEALVVALVLPPPTHAGGLDDILDTDTVGEQAAQLAARLWPEKYRWDAASDDPGRKTPARHRLLQRYDTVSAWRASRGEAPVPVPTPPAIPPVPPEEARARINAWLEAERGEAAWIRAADAVVASGLGILPALREVRATLDPKEGRSEAFDGLLLRPTALILRDVVWTPTSSTPPAGLSAFLERSQGKPIDGRWVTAALGVFARSAPKGVNSLDLAVLRPGDDTGAVVVLDLSSRAVSTAGGNTEGWSLTHGGWEHVDPGEVGSSSGSWWQDARAATYDQEFHVPDTEEIRRRWTLVRIQAP